MSISSDSEPPYNEFYDNQEVSDGESEGFIDRTVKKTKPTHTRTPKKDQTFLTGLLAPFEGCCFSKGPPGPPRHAGSARVSGPLSEFVLQTYELPDEEDGGLEGDSSTDSDEVALGATAKSYKHSQPGKAKVATDVLRERVEAEGVKWRNLASTSALDSTAKWVVSLPLLEAIDLGLMQLTNDQKRLAALYWCRSVTLSQKMTTRLLEKIVSVARWELPAEMTIDMALRKREEFGTLEFQQIIESRLIEEIMGEFEQQATADDPSATFLVISKARTVATVARKQGDALLITVFDGGYSKDRGPACLGFDSVEATEKYLIDLYTEDPMEAKTAGKFSAWTIINKQFANPLKNQQFHDKGLLAPGEEKQEKPLWDIDQAEEGAGDVTEDAQHGAKLAYTAMYKAADTPMEQENVFTQTAGGALQVKKTNRDKKNKR